MLDQINSNMTEVTKYELFSKTLIQSIEALKINLPTDELFSSLKRMNYLIKNVELIELPTKLNLYLNEYKLKKKT